ncbi:hypothetical protein GF371_03110 [Candidatus Woesearchaeota archaeon]|nr:hypothetical protein [Candidatus Woesearchaeota archaeon]
MFLILASSFVCAQDSDNDGLTDAQEAQYGTNPNNPDTDGDRVNDGTEVQQNRNPLQLDLDTQQTVIVFNPSFAQPNGQVNVTLQLWDVNTAYGQIPNIAVNLALSNPSFGSLVQPSGTTDAFGQYTTVYNAPNQSGAVTISAYATNLNNQLLTSRALTILTAPTAPTPTPSPTPVTPTPGPSNPRAYWVMPGTFNVANCGNGQQDPGEECDDGNNARGDGCDPFCRLECGNGVADPGEECGDPGTRGCPPSMVCDSYTCKCIPKPPEIARCCDGMISPPEECEHGGQMSIPPCLPFFNPATWSRIECPAKTCKCTNRQDPPKASSAYCGDGYLQTGLGEDCDDGNQISGDGCSYPGCKIEYCGDGVVQFGFRVAVPHTPPYIFYNMTEECEPPGTLGCDMFCQLANITNATPPQPPPAPPAPTPPPVPPNNTCPNMSAVYISKPAFNDTNITANATGFNDPDGDNASFNYNWYRNGNLVENYTIQNPIGVYHGPKNRGDIITVVVRPFDGYCYGNPVNDSVIIGNRPPMILSFTNDGPKWCGSNFVLTANAFDPDGDNLYYLFHFGDVGLPAPPPPPPVPVPVPIPTPPPIHCVNNVWDGNESDLDCGGPCGGCPPLNNPQALSCWNNNDCQSGNCDMSGALPLPATDPNTNMTYNTTTQIRQLAGQTWIIPYQGTCRLPLPSSPPPPGNVTGLIPSMPVGGNYTNLNLTIGNTTYRLPLPPPLIINGSISTNVTNDTDPGGNVSTGWTVPGWNITFYGNQTLTISVPPFGNVTIVAYVALINGQLYYFPPNYQPFIPPLPPGGLSSMSISNTVTHQYNTSLNHTFFTATVYVFDGATISMATTQVEVYCNNATFGCAPPQNLIAVLDDDLTSVNLSWTMPSTQYNVTSFAICPVGNLNSTSDVSSSSPEFMAACNQFGITLPSTLSNYKDTNAQHYPERYYKVMSICSAVPGAPTAGALSSETVGKYEIPVRASQKFNEISLPLKPYYNSVHEVFKSIGTGMGLNNAQYSPPQFIYCGAQNFIGNYEEIRTFVMDDFLTAIGLGAGVQQAVINASKLYDPVADCRLYSYTDVYDLYTADLGELYAIKVAADDTLINVGEFVYDTNMPMYETDVYLKDNWFGYPLVYALNTVIALVSDDEQTSPFDQNYIKIKHFNVHAYENALAQNLSETQAEAIASEDYVPNLPGNLSQTLALQQLMPGKGYRLEMNRTDTLAFNHKGNR